MQKTAKNQAKNMGEAISKKASITPHSIEDINKNTFLSSELFSALSLTPQEEHELLQNLFISAVRKSLQKKSNHSNFPFGKQVVIESNNKDVKAGLAKAEEKIGRALNASVDSDEDGDEDEMGDGKSSFPNLKYAQPKYKNVESILKYIETPDDKGGVKLVIMNFND